jgi:hypothetical protein
MWPEPQDHSISALTKRISHRNALHGAATAQVTAKQWWDQ